MKNNTRKLTQAAMIAGLYAAITFATFFMSFGAVQYRVSEALTILPVFTASAVPGLSVGCALANLIGFFMGINPAGGLDAVFGTAATLIAAVMTYCIGKSEKRWVRYVFAPLPPVLANALIVGLEICIFFEGAFTWELFAINRQKIFSSHRRKPIYRLLSNKLQPRWITKFKFITIFPII